MVQIFLQATCKNICHQLVVINVWGNSCLYWRFNLAHSANKVAGPARPFKTLLAEFSLDANHELKLNDNSINMTFKALFTIEKRANKVTLRYEKQTLNCKL